MEITKYTKDQAGCLIDGHWGQYGTARMIQLAHAHGYPRESGIVSLAEAKLDNMGPGVPEYELNEKDEEALSDAAAEVETWMNENIAPEGYQFGWNDGEFFLQEDFWWDDDDYDEPEDYIPVSNGWDEYDEYDLYDMEYDV